MHFGTLIDTMESPLSLLLKIRELATLVEGTSFTSS